MSKKTREKKNFDMSMSATILREIVASSFGVKAKNVVLSGELSPETIFQHNAGHSWWSGAEEKYETCWGWSPEGFKRITYLDLDGFEDTCHTSLLKNEYQFYDNGDTYHEEGSQLLDLEGVDKFIFFVVFSRGKYYGENGETFATWTLYKAPNFAQKWAEIEKLDLQRWEEWLPA